MKITADTDVLVRALTGDHERQSGRAQRVLVDADVVALALPALCENKIPSTDITEAIRRLTNASSVVVNRPAVDAGLALLEMGGDFADGVIAYEGSRLGAEIFASFDKKAIKLWKQRVSPPVCCAECLGPRPATFGASRTSRRSPRPAGALGLVDVRRD
jgi:predicted nucleic-acid-binding protein